MAYLNNVRAWAFYCGKCLNFTESRLFNNTWCCWLLVVVGGLDHGKLLVKSYVVN